MTDELRQALNERRAREERGHAMFYQPFEEGTSNLLRRHYAQQLKLSPQGQNLNLYFKSGLQLATGYNRIVIGDYGAYVEIRPDQLVHENVRNRWPRSQRAAQYVKYWWMVPVDGTWAKVYEQVRTVRYADYRAGMFYVSEQDLRL